MRSPTAPTEHLQVGAAARPALDVVAAVQALVDELDPAQAPARHAADLVRVFDRIGRIAEAGKAMAAARVAESSLWRRGGHRSPAHWMARQTGVGVGEAARQLDTADVVAASAEVGEALTSGRVSPRQARAIAKAAEADPDAGSKLLADADRLSVGELETAVGRIEAAARHESDTERAERLRRSRSLASGVDGEGMGWGRWRLPIAEHTRLMAQIAGGTEAAFERGRRSGDREPAEAYAADGLVALADRAVGPPASPGSAADGGEGRDRWRQAKVIVRVDADALDRGEVARGERCEVAGAGPIPVVDAWRIIDGGALVAAITTRGTEIERVVHLGRRPTALQRTALEWMTAGTCAVEGCDSTARLEVDHVADWAATGRTELRELAAVCGHHHDLKTHHGHRFGPRQATGTRRLLPPPDPEANGPERVAGAELHRRRPPSRAAPGDPTEWIRLDAEQPDLFDTG